VRGRAAEARENQLFPGLPCPLTADAIFVAGFEDGTTNAWSSTSP
jgi:hypothetical protein